MSFLLRQKPLESEAVRERKKKQTNCFNFFSPYLKQYYQMSNHPPF